MMHIHARLQVVYGPGFAPRPVTTAFTDTAEIGARPPVLPGTSVPDIQKEDNRPGDAIRYTCSSKLVSPSRPLQFHHLSSVKEIKRSTEADGIDASHDMKHARHPDCG